MVCPRSKPWAASLALLALFLLAGCMVGPKYSKPSVPMTPAYKEPPPDSFKESGNWRPAKPADSVLPGKWWQVYKDPRLNDLEDRLEVSNLSLKTAEARFSQARSAVRYNRSFQQPTVTTQPQITSLRDSARTPYFGAAAVPATGEFILPGDLSYEIDFWGRIRRLVSASREEAQASAGDLAFLSLSLHAELAVDFFELHSLDLQQQILNETVKSYTDALRLTTNLFEGGASSRLEVAQAQTQLAATQAQATDVAVLRSEYEHAIAVLIGQPPATFTLLVEPLQATPPPVPVGLPSELLERRPDIAAAERRVAEANDQIGISQAAFYPTVMLSATAGFEGSSLLNWFSWPARFWAVGPSAIQTLYDAGRRRASLENSTDNYDALVGSYRQVTLTAFEQVEDNLSALRVLENEAGQQRDAVLSAQNLLAISLNRYKGGVDTYLQVITSQTTALTSRQIEADILRRRMDASVLLIKALGGGWTESNLPTVSSLR